jgi:hypothetical protein
MFPYLIVFVIVIFYYQLAQPSYKHNNKFLFFFLLYVALFIGLGDMIGGYDRYIYGDEFDSIANEMRGGRQLWRYFYLVDGHEWGYFYWNVFVSMFTENRYIFILVTTLAAYALYYRAFKLYVEDYPLAVILFMGLFYYFTMTYLRQVLACGILWQGLRYIWERKPVRFFAIAVLAYTFHSSAIVFFPMYFLPFWKFTKEQIVIFLLLALLVGLTSIPMKMIAAGGENNGKDYVDQMQGFRIEYVLEVVLFMWVIFKNYKYIPTDRKTLTMLNGSVIFCGSLLFFMRFGQGGRISWFFIFPLIYMFTMLANRRNAFFWMRPGIILVCFALWLRLTYGWEEQNVPYKTFLTDGEPSGNGRVYELYEYDKNYTYDKFYRKAFDLAISSKQ